MLPKTIRCWIFSSELRATLPLADGVEYGSLEWLDNHICLFVNCVLLLLLGDPFLSEPCLHNVEVFQKDPNLHEMDVKHFAASVLCEDPRTGVSGAFRNSRNPKR